MEVHELVIEMKLLERRMTLYYDQWYEELISEAA